ncbi:energy transducer TonB, partial [Marinobacter sp. Z-F4-2]
MPEKSSPNALPAAYRLGLALSLALFLHTLLLSGISSPKEEPTVTHRESVRFELVAPGTLRTVADPSADLSPRRDAPRVTSFEIDPPEPEPLSKPEVVTSREPQTPAPTK